MGRAITREHFAKKDYGLFEARLRENLDALSDVLSRPGFGIGPMTIGAELEAHLVDSAGRPRPVNAEVVESAGDKRVNIELAKYNIELNTRPAVLSAQSFDTLADELRELLGCAGSAAAQYDARPVLIGILPTVGPSYFVEEMITDASRFRALSNGRRRIRGDPYSIAISGRDGRELDIVTRGFAVAGVNTSFQIHLRVCPSDFGAVYNAVQLATAPALAVSGNSPLFLAHELWEETRIALMPQAFEFRPSTEHWRQSRVSFGMDWCRSGALELFAETVAQHPPLLPVIGVGPRGKLASNAAPMLEELRLHQGTVWRWNRPVYDDSAGGHVRIEMRALPSGPTIVDMVANAAFMIGLSLGLAPNIEALTAKLTFADAEKNFIEAARRGLEAELLWPRDGTFDPRPEGARHLVQRLLPVAYRGLLSAGVSDAEAEPLLAIIEARASSGQTGAAWQRRFHESHLARCGEPSASRALVEAYIRLSREGLPVHAWRV